MSELLQFFKENIGSKIRPDLQYKWLHNNRFRNVQKIILHEKTFAQFRSL